ncbi:MAG: plasmid stabilization protein, partial [Ilumatobacter sp.]
MLVGRRVGRIAALLASALVAVACGSGDDGPSTITVPDDAPTIQQAVDRAEAGDLVLIEPGIYREQVVI